MSLLMRALTRALIWRRIIRGFRGLTLTSQLNLFVSALVDILASLIVKPSNPLLHLSGLYLSSEGLTVYVRGGTDDLYNLLPGREGSVDLVIRRVLRSGDVFVDVGANVGYYTLLAARKGCKVVAVEPVPQTLAVLRINLRLNRLEGLVTVVGKCAWSSRGHVKLAIPQGKFFGLASTVLNRGKSATVDIECVDLDSVLCSYSEVRLMKIDVEGAEYEVLKGADSALRKTDFIVVELTRNVKNIIGMLLGKGYRIKRLGFSTYILASNDIKIVEEGQGC
ncbi:MAG: FkbM family methyltransferase [Thermofilaceae archaeon]